MVPSEPSEAVRTREIEEQLRRATEKKLLFYLSQKEGLDIPVGDSFKVVRQVRWQQRGDG